MIFETIRSIAYFLLPMVLPCLFGVVVYTVFALLTRKKFPTRPGTHVLRYLFSAYLAAVVSLTLVSFGSGAGMGGGANFVPFSSVVFAVLSGSEVARQLIVLNIVLFIPMGAFLPWVFPKKINRLYQAALVSFLATFAIECLQVVLPGGRIFDIDDILMNTLGGCIGYALFVLILWITGRSKPLRSEKIVGLAVMAALPALIIGMAVADAGVSQYDPLSFSIRVPKEAKVTAQGDFPQTAMVYEQAHTAEELMASLMERFGVEGEPQRGENDLTAAQGETQLSVEKNAQWWSVMLRATTDEPPEETDAALIDAARIFLEQYGLWKDGLVFEDIFDLMIEENGTERVSGKNVSFAASEGDPRFFGTLSVWLDNKGVVEVYSGLNVFAPGEEKELMTPQEAADRMMQTHRCYVAHDQSGAWEPERMDADRVELIYFPGPHGANNLPVWKLTGAFYEGGRQSSGYLLVAAIK